MAEFTNPNEPEHGRADTALKHIASLTGTYEQIAEQAVLIAREALGRRGATGSGTQESQPDIDGHEALWWWFGGSRAAFLTLPRVLMHAMPHDWQGQMAQLLEQYDKTFPNQPDIGTRVQAVQGNRLVKFPEWVLNYRRPDTAAIDALRGTT